MKKPIESLVVSAFLLIPLLEKNQQGGMLFLALVALLVLALRKK
jgi:hypothetical protein